MQVNSKCGNSRRSLLRAANYALALIGLLSLPAYAESMEERLKATLATPATRTAAVVAGKKAAFFCVNCHGDDGISKQSDVPNMAGQHPVYLFGELQKFANGQRRDEFMQGLMKLINDTDRLNMAVYYASLDAKPAGTTTSTAGRDLYAKLCVACHGERAQGSEKFPRLAGQQVAYLKNSLTRYRNRSGNRIDPGMAAVTTGLKDLDVSELAIYLSAMR